MLREDVEEIDRDVLLGELVAALHAACQVTSNFLTNLLTSFTDKGLTTDDSNGMPSECKTQMQLPMLPKQTTTLRSQPTTNNKREDMTWWMK